MPVCGRVRCVLSAYPLPVARGKEIGTLLSLQSPRQQAARERGRGLSFPSLSPSYVPSPAEYSSVVSPPSKRLSKHRTEQGGGRTLKQAGPGGQKDSKLRNDGFGALQANTRGGRRCVHGDRPIQAGRSHKGRWPSAGNGDAVGTPSRWQDVIVDGSAVAVLCCRSLMLLCQSGVFSGYVGLIKKQAPVKWISPSNPVAHLRSAWNDNIFAICRSAYPDDRPTTATSRRPPPKRPRRPGPRATASPSSPDPSRSPAVGPGGCVPNGKV